MPRPIRVSPPPGRGLFVTILTLTLHLHHMKAPSTIKRHRLVIDTVETAITSRARKIVQKLVDSGTPIEDIARYTDTTILSLLDGASPRLGRPQYMALFTHFHVNPMWLWTGLGPEIIHTTDQTVQLS